MSRVTHSYLDQGEIEKVMAELNRIISINDLLCSGYVMEQSLKGLCFASLMLTPFVMEVIFDFGLGSTILKQSRVLAGSSVSSVCGVKKGGFSAAKTDIF